MNLFFGKISQKFDIEQLKEGYYSAPKGSSWFGDIAIGDYVYMIGGNKVQFWQAKEWGIRNGRDSLVFNILSSDLGINVSQLIVLKFLKITKSLAVMTSRSARNKAFFSLEKLEDITVEDLSNPQFYKNAALYRTIRIIKKEDVIKDSEDIQLTYENNRLELVDNDFIDASIKKEFVDNLDKKGKGARMKDNVLKFLSNAIVDLPATITHKKIGLRSFYDTFFCDYKTNQKYFVVGAFWDTENPQDQTERFVREGIWFNGYTDKFNADVNAVPVGSNIAIKAAFVRGKTDAVMTIKARGVVTKNLQDGQTLEVEWEEDFTQFEVSFGGYMKTIKEVTKKKHIDAIWNHDEALEDETITTDLPKKMKSPINQILYGPPGTGKTYKLQQIIEDWGLKSNKSAEKDYTAFVKDFTWWKIIALALLDKGKSNVPDLAQHPLIIAKLGISNIKSLKTRLWSSLQHHCVDHCENVKLVKRIGERVFYKESNSEWRLDDVEAFRLEYNALIEAYEDFKTGDNIESKDYTFTTCHQSLTYEDFIEGIKPELNKVDEDEDEEETEGKELVYEIRKGVFYNACEKAAQKAGYLNLKACIEDKKNRKATFEKAIAENKIHVIFLDEINRCNVSSVFGELITLIEEDKRLGNENEIDYLTLPYSQQTFGVPANLFIIGTMNTADRSIEALDTALRRRFCFEEMTPQTDLLKDKNVNGVNLKALLEIINKRIEILLDRDHTIGHSYFIKITNDAREDLKAVFKNNILPLLQEYFYSDYEKIGMILGEGFVEIVEKDEVKFPEYIKNNHYKPKQYNLIPIDDDFNIIDAIGKLWK